jgi:hypothetical protein
LFGVVVVGVVEEVELQENEPLEVLVPVTELALHELELDDAVCAPWNETRVGRLEGTVKSGQLLPWAASMKERQIGPEVGPPNPVESRESGCPVHTAVEYSGV